MAQDREPFQSGKYGKARWSNSQSDSETTDNSEGSGGSGGGSTPTPRDITGQGSNLKYSGKVNNQPRDITGQGTIKQGTGLGGSSTPKTPTELAQIAEQLKQIDPKLSLAYGQAAEQAAKQQAKQTQAIDLQQEYMRSVAISRLDPSIQEIRNSQGNVIGVHDVGAQMSYRADDLTVAAIKGQRYDSNEYKIRPGQDPYRSKELTPTQKQNKEMLDKSFAKVIDSSPASFIAGIFMPKKQQPYTSLIGEGAAMHFYSLVSDPLGYVKGSLRIFYQPKQVITETIQAFKTDPYRSTGSLIAGVVIAKGVSVGVGKVGVSIKNTYVKFGSEFVLESEVIGGSFTKAGSIPESLEMFSKTKIVQTSSPAAIAGRTAGIGKKASLGLEDPGIYVSPKGHGQSYFLGIKDKLPVEYSINPLKGFRERLGTPTITEFEIVEVRQQPRTVVNQPGFIAASRFLEEQGRIQSGVVYITKRSEIGQGLLQRQAFKNPVSGKVMLELGTSEVEAVIPPGQSFYYKPQTLIGSVKGFDRYTIVEGRAVAIRRAKLLGSEESIPGSGRLIQGSRIAREFEALSSSGYEARYVTPISSLKYSLSFSNYSALRSDLQSLSVISDYSRSSRQSGQSDFRNRLVSNRGNSYSFESYGFDIRYPRSSQGSMGSQRSLLGSPSSYYSNQSSSPLEVPGPSKKREQIQLRNYEAKNNPAGSLLRRSPELKYSPNLFAVINQIKGKRTKGLTGLELRGI